MLLPRIILGLWLGLFNPQYSTCMRCHIPWNHTTHHTTDVNPGGGLFPLDEWCWQRLTPQERLPYYRKLWDSWEHPTTQFTWAEVETAVLAGK